MAVRSIALGALFAASVVVSMPAKVALAAECGVGASQAAQSRPYAFARAARGDVESALRVAGRDLFLRGVVNSLAKRHADALDAFAAAEDDVGLSSAWKRGGTRAKIAFWASRSLQALGRQADARRAMALAALQGGTFYGLIADGARLDNGQYPAPRFPYLDPRTPQALVLAVIRVESRFILAAHSSANALGLMQVIPPTASRVTRSVGLQLDERRMLTDGHYNVAIGSTYLGDLTSRYRGYLPLAIAAYNAGEGCVDRWLQQIGDPRTEVDPVTWIEAIPLDETREYVKSVLAAYMGYETGLAKRQ